MFLLHHENKRPHDSAKTLDAITSLIPTVVPHPPYSPDLAPSGFWLFQQLKETLKGKNLSSSAKVEAAVRISISIQLENFFIDRVKNG
jgi:histone-lysine N-methyltransferase SETMAR